MNKFKLGTFGIMLLSSTVLIAQEIVGSWNGTLNVQSQEIPIVFHVSLENDIYTSTMDSPSQGANNIPTDATTYVDNELIIDMTKLGIVYKAKFDGKELKGIFTQGGFDLPLDLVRGSYHAPKKNQEPKEPFPYESEEVYFENPKAGNIKLAGTLTIPNNVANPPVAILISGSGAQNRNEEIMGHKPFLVLSDHLTRNGVAVLRYDDRGYGSSEGLFEKATTYDFASDVDAAVAYLRTRKTVVDINKIGLIGHSEGGLIGPIVASKNKEIAFCVLLSGPGTTGKEVLMSQSKRAMELMAMSQEDIATNEMFSSRIYAICEAYKGEESDKEIRAIFGELKNSSSEMLKSQLTDEIIEQQIKLMTSDWMLIFIKIDPKDYLSKLTCPVLAMNGAKDFQVDSKDNLKGIQEGLDAAGNHDVTTRELEDLNHLFQTSVTGSISEYGLNEETFSPIALKMITDWINERF